VQRVGVRVQGPVFHAALGAHPGVPQGFRAAPDFPLAPVAFVARDRRQERLPGLRWPQPRRRAAVVAGLEHDALPRVHFELVQLPHLMKSHGRGNPSVFLER